MAAPALPLSTLPCQLGLDGGMNGLGWWGWQRAEPGFCLKSILCSHLPRCPLQMRPWRGAPCSPCSLFWLSSPCSDYDSRPWTTANCPTLPGILGLIGDLLPH